jgi:dolichol-phosphate mannosyltransferase
LKKTSAHLIVIPAYNEEETIEEVVLRSKKYADTCVVDDCSQDRTAEILGTIHNIHVIRHEKNTHIPGGLLDGMRYAVEKGYDYIISLDAGLSHDPDEISRFIDHPHSDLAIGIRVVKTDTPLFRKMLSKTGNLIYNCCLDFPASLFKRKYYKDITSGYRRYSKEAMKLILSKKIESSSFDILFESAMFIYKNGLTISEVPISYAFSNSSLNTNVVKDCLKMCLKSVINPRT